MALPDPAQVLKDIENVVNPIVTKVRTDSEAEMSKVADEAKAAAKSALINLRGQVGAASEIARGAFVEAVQNAEPGVKSAVQNVLDGEFQNLLKVLSQAVI